MAAQNIYVDNVIHQNESSVFPYPFDILLNPHMTISEKRERIPHIVTALEEFNGILSAERPGFWTGTQQTDVEPSTSSQQEQPLPPTPTQPSSTRRSWQPLPPSPTQPSSTRRGWQPLPPTPTQPSPIQPSSSRGDWQPRPPPSSDGTPWQGRRLPSWVIELGDEDYTSDDDDADYISGFADDDDDDDILFANVIDLPDYEPPTPQLGSHYTIEQLPTSQITSQQTDDGLTCTVCCSEYNLDETVCQTACKHYFHADCLEPWIQGRLTCPVCRQNVFVLQDSEDN